MNRMISRRAMVRDLTGAVLLVGTGLTAACRPSASKPSRIQASQIRHSVCKWCFRDIPLAQFSEAVKAIGIESIELLELSDRPVLEKHGLTNAMVKGVPGHIRDGLNTVANHDKIVAYFEHAIPEAADAGYPNIICFSGNRSGLDDATGLENCARGLQRILPLAERYKVNVVMELLNSKKDHKDYMADRSAWGCQLCEKLGSERFKLLYDIYHMQIMEGDVIDTIRRNHRYFAHYHTAGVPGRHEIGADQELRYEAIVKAIVDTGYRGFIGQEFIPAGIDPLASLRAAIEICSA